jgi:NAD(P)-dependent dehydrogenase (short-subunit alcohol dehydrogenase family)
VFGVLAVYQVMLPLPRESSDARIVNVSSGVGSLTTNADPADPYHAFFGPNLNGYAGTESVEDGPARWFALRCSARTVKQARSRGGKTRRSRGDALPTRLP